MRTDEGPNWHQSCFTMQRAYTEANQAFDQLFERLMFQTDDPHLKALALRARVAIR